MKLRIRVSNCAFLVPVKPGRIPPDRGSMSRSQVISTRGSNLNSRDGNADLAAGRRPALRRHCSGAWFARAFTLIELLTVIAIIGILAALVAPVFIHFSKPDVTEAATRQMLDDVARARQLAISQRSTVYMVFIPTNFWKDPFNATAGANAWQNLVSDAPTIPTSTLVTQMYGAQWTGYLMESLRNVGDQPGRSIPKDLVKLKTLPDGAFFAPIKFTLPKYYFSPGNALIVSNYPIYGFLTASNIPFPTADVLTNPLYVATLNANPPGTFNYVTVPYIAFNYLGQLTPGDGSVLPYDEYIPLAYGRLLPSRDAKSKAYIQGVPIATEVAAGGSTNISYNIIHIDRITGRARVERQDAQ